MRNIFQILSIILLGFISYEAQSQFYRGNEQEFGKNRVQYDEFQWQFYHFSKYDIYFYAGGKSNAIYTAKVVPEIIEELEGKFDYYLDEKIQFIIYNKFSHFKQSNIGINDDNQNDIGGITRIVDSKVFIYFNGDHKDLEQQIRAGVTNILTNRLMLGVNWKEVLRNSALLTIPDWYINGLVSYMSGEGNPVIENKIKDGVLSGKFLHLNHLNKKDAVLAGHAMWKYIANTYGEKVIPNILYMSRLSRNVESGFLYVVGLSLKSLTKETSSYFTEFYKLSELSSPTPENPISLKTNKKKLVSEVKISPDGKYISYVTNELGKYQVILYDISNKKSKIIHKGGYKLDWINDFSYPKIEFHPKSTSLVIITEKKAKNQITFYDIESKEKTTKPLLKIDKVVDMSFAPNGKTIVLSAISKGQTDIYEYKILSNHQKRITNDIYDDVAPTYYNGQIIFSSNRFDDTLRTDHKIEKVNNTYDLFMYRPFSRKKVLKRVTNTPKYNETQPVQIDSAHFSFLSNERGANNRFIAYFDSVISHIDTAFHYRYITKYEAQTHYSRNILEYQYSPTTNQYAELFYRDKNYIINISEASLNAENVAPIEQQDSEKSAAKKTTAKRNLLVAHFVIPEEILPDTAIINYNNYIFELEKKDYLKRKKAIEVAAQQQKAAEELAKADSTTTIVKDSVETDSKVAVIKKTLAIKSEASDFAENLFTLPKQKDYKLSYTYLDVQTQMNFNYATQMYQRYTGSLGYFNTKIGSEMSVKLVDLFNNHQVKGGVRYSFDMKNREFFLDYLDRTQRMNKIFTVARQTNEFSTNYRNYKFIYNQVQLGLKYPISEVLSVRGTSQLRYDKLLELSSELPSLKTPTQGETMAGLKFELVFDNTSPITINMLKGTRGKFFAETYNGIFSSSVTGIPDSNIVTSQVNVKPDILILGFDVRKYVQLHREIIWATRFSGGTSLGDSKLLYYMGGVDNKIHITDKPRFNYDLPVTGNNNYAFQTVATNMRGFLQNARNGNNYLMINSEIRALTFKYFANRPLKSDFIKNFQTILFTDIGTAWSGKNPFSEDNYFNSTVVEDGNVKVVLKNQDNPIIGSYGFGFRSRVLGYFMKLDIAWGVEDGRVKSPKGYLSVGLDF